MPPRKKARTTPSTITSPTPVPSTPAAAPSSPRPAPSTLKQTPAASTSASSPSTFPNDPWTPAQETDLFKAMIRYKPTGIHKHFHMLCISSYLRSHGHCLLPPTASGSVSSAKGTATTASVSAADDASESETLLPHTRIPGIWARLHTLYDLDSLDEREDANTIGPAEQATEDWDPNGETTREFALPEYTDAEFSQMMWRRRWYGEKDSKGIAQDVGDGTGEGSNLSSSPPTMEVMRGRDGVVVSEDETSPTQGKARKGRGRAKAAPAPTPPPAAAKKQGRGRGGGLRGGRSSVAKPEPEASPSEEDAAEDEEGEEGSGFGEEPESGAEEGSEASKEEEEQASESAEEEVEAEAEVEAPSPPARGTRSKAVGGGRGTGKRGRGRGARK